MRRVLQEMLAGEGRGLMITVSVSKVTRRVTFDTETVIMTVVPS